MAEHDENDPAATPPREPRPPAAAAGPGDATHANEGAAPPPRVEQPAQAVPAGPGRARRWSGSGTVRMAAVTLAAGLVGGLVGGGIVAAFDHDDGPDRTVHMRFQPGMRGDVGPGFRGPRYWGRPPDGGWFVPKGPGAPAPTAPATPTPKSSG
jgi:hypothetical protein